MDDLGRDEGARHETRMGTRWVEMGTYVSVCFVRWRRERAIWRWKGCERLFGTSLIKKFKMSSQKDQQGENSLDSSNANLHERVYKCSELTFFSGRSLSIDIASASKNDAPKVNAVYKLPVVHIFVRFL